MTFSKYILFGAIALSAPAFTACVGDLDVEPENPTTKTEITSADDLYNELAGVYGGLVFEGGITVDDGGTGVYTRQLWNLQELCTDETLIGSNWGDAGLSELIYSTWSTDNHWLYECFSRFNYQISISNQFLRDLKKHASLLPESGNLSAEVLGAEARTIRALSYYHMIDIFGRGPWSTENSQVGITPPTYDSKELFEAVVEDLKDAIPSLVPASQQIYGRLSREAGYMLLAKLYLNAEVYTGEARWQDCANACNEIRKTIDNLAPTYKYLFCATNDKYVGNGEIIWGIPQDATSLTTYGGTTYLSGGSYRGDSDLLKTLGVSVSGWAGPRVREELAKAFAEAYMTVGADCAFVGEPTTLPKSKTSATRIRATCASSMSTPLKPTTRTKPRMSPTATPCSTPPTIPSSVWPTYISCLPNANSTTPPAATVLK